jgi:sporulation related protein
MLRSVLAFFWIALAGVSGVYLYSALADPSSLSGQFANPLPVGSGEMTGAFSGSGSRDQELAEIKASLIQLSRQMAAISTKLNLDQDALATPQDTSAPETASEPEAPAAPEPEVKPEVAAAPPPPAPAPPVAEAKPEPEPVAAPKPEPKPEAKPIEQAAVEPKPTPAEVKPAPKPFEPPAVAVSPIDDLPAEEESETSAEQPAAAPTPSPTSTPAASPTTPAPSTATAPTPSAPAPTAPPPPVESAALDPVALPPAANDGSTRYGIEIGVVAKQDGLRPLWREFLTNHAALVAGLQPRRVLAPDKKWRLIAGPFGSAAEATQACALFKKASRPCEATVYAGDGL